MLQSMDRKSTIIIALLVIIVFLIAYIAGSKYQEVMLKRQELAFEQGFRSGQLNEQRNAISQIQNIGFYTINYLDENNETQPLRLSLVPSTSNLGQAET